MKTPPDILRCMTAPKLWGPTFTGASWDNWKVFLAALFALPMTAAQLAIYQEFTGRIGAPLKAFAEATLVCGRRAGKSRILALIATWLAVFVDWTPYLAEGETATVAILCADRLQARNVLRYCKGLIAMVPTLQAMVEGPEHSQRIVLSNRVVIEITTASHQLARGYSFAAVLADEVAFWSTAEDAAVNDLEVLRALRPGLLTLRPAGSLLLMASSPYSRRGALWESFKRYYGEEEAPVLVWKAPTLVMHPTLDREEIDRMRVEDPDAAKSEYDAEFRQDLQQLLTRETVEGCVIPGRRELPRVGGVMYRGFCDPSGGSSDSMTMAIAHSEPNGRANIGILDCVREFRPPFDPDAVAGEISDLLRSYGVSTVVGDRFGGDWVASRFTAHGISYQPSEKSKSDIYVSALPLLNAGRVELLDNDRLVTQLCSLERRTGRGTGKDIVDHPPRQHDDIANAACGVLTLVAGQPDYIEVWLRCGGFDPTKRERGPVINPPMHSGRF
jgi:hypothetical protein